MTFGNGSHDPLQVQQWNEEMLELLASQPLEEPTASMALSLVSQIDQWLMKMPPGEVGVGREEGGREGGRGGGREGGREGGGEWGGREGGGEGGREGGSGEGGREGRREKGKE